MSRDVGHRRHLCGFLHEFDAFGRDGCHDARDPGRHAVEDLALQTRAKAQRRNCQPDPRKHAVQRGHVAERHNVLCRQSADLFGHMAPDQQQLDARDLAAQHRHDALRRPLCGIDIGRMAIAADEGDPRLPRAYLGNVAQRDGRKRSVKSACRRSCIEAMMDGWQRQQTECPLTA